MARTLSLRKAVLLTTLVGLALTASGCGYLKNVRDDFLDMGTFAVGIVPPVAPTEDGPKAVGILPPALGLYVQITDFFHLGALYKVTGDLELDRRGWGTTVDARRKFGIGPFHDVSIRQAPICVNAYKTTNNEMDGWRQHMVDLSDPLFKAPGKTLIYEPKVYTGYSCDYSSCGGDSSWERLPYFYRGWQSWEFIQVEVAIPCICFFHTGVYLRAGFDISESFDFLLGLVCVDLYSDAAFKFNGELKH